MINFVDILIRRSIEHPEIVAYRFFHGADLAYESLTYGELFEKASTLAAFFQQTFPFQSRLLIVCKSQENFTVVFFACLLAGMIAVPTALPRRNSLLTRFHSLANDAQVCACVFDCSEMENCELEIAGKSIEKVDMRKFIFREVNFSTGFKYQSMALEENTIAFLQYTSGSTGTPKGVIISHENLIHNSAVIQDAMQITNSSVMFTALPMFHDMGLVGGLIQPMFSGCVGNWLTPTEFVQYPERWIQILSKFKVTVAGGPNFIYSLAAKTVKDEQIENADLSHLRVAFCGAEPIRASTIDHFCDRFACYGFKRDSFYPCYGMAESTLFITGNYIGKTPRITTRNGVDIVSCGITHRDMEVRIVNPQNCSLLPDSEIGEIWVAGKSVASGYWNHPELNAEQFHACISQQDGIWLRTGDLGFIEDRELFVTGRCKDIIISYGRKYAPQDIEECAELSHTGLKEAGGAAFSVLCDDKEVVILVFELNREWLRRHAEWEKIIARIRQSTRESFGLSIEDIVLIKPGALPRTSSGKVMRSQCRIDYINGNIERLTKSVVVSL